MKATLIVLLAGLYMASAIPSYKIKTNAIRDYEQVVKAKSIRCSICTLVVTEVDNILVQAETEQQAIDLIKHLCATLNDAAIPGIIRTCNNFVETNLPLIIEGLVNNQLSPASVCGGLGLC